MTPVLSQLSQRRSPPATTRDRTLPEIRSARGSWEHDPSHFPLPLTPSFASVYLAWQDAGMRAMFGEFGCVAEGIESRTLDGYLCYRVRPVGGWSPPPWLAAIGLRLWWAHPPLCRRVRLAIRRARENHAERVLRAWEHTWRPRIEDELRGLVRLDLTSMSDAGLLAHLDRVCAWAARNIRLHFVLHGAIAQCMYPLHELCRSIPALADIAESDLIAGLSPRSSEPGRALAALASHLREHPETYAAAVRLGTSRFLEEMEREDPAFARAFAVWIEAHGHRITARYELIEPALAEQPERILSLVLDLAARPDGSVSADAAAAVRREAAVARARARLAHLDVRVAFDAALARAQRAFPVRDDNVVLTLNSSFAVLRYALLEVGRRWSEPPAAGQRCDIATLQPHDGSLVCRPEPHLDRPEDVFFLTVDEIRNGLTRGNEEQSEWIALHAAARRRTWERQLRSPRPPIHVGPYPPLPPFDALPSEAATVTRAMVWYMQGIQSLDAPGAAGPASAGAASRRSSIGDALPPSGVRRGAVIRGIAAAGGLYRGVARVIRDESDFDRLCQGDVLVCAMTSPAWSALFPLAGAVVTDHGGVLSHPAVLAREYAIPAVVATRTATTRIPDGAAVEVDGDAGVVTVEADKVRGDTVKRDAESEPG